MEDSQITESLARIEAKAFQYLDAAEELAPEITEAALTYIFYRGLIGFMMFLGFMIGLVLCARWSVAAAKAATDARHNEEPPHIMAAVGTGIGAVVCFFGAIVSLVEFNRLWIAVFDPKAALVGRLLGL